MSSYFIFIKYISLTIELIKAVKEWNIRDGVIMELTTIAASHQNGPAERTIQTVDADSRAMIKDVNSHLSFGTKQPKQIAT